MKDESKGAVNRRGFCSAVAGLALLPLVPAPRRLRAADLKIHVAPITTIICDGAARMMFEQGVISAETFALLYGQVPCEAVVECFAELAS